MKKKLIVFDFDNTLINFDSFRLFALKWVKLQPLTAFYILLRKLRLMRASDFKKNISLSAQKSDQLDGFIGPFIEGVLSNVNRDLLQKPMKEKGAQYELLILSASPHFYMERLGQSLGVRSQGSYFNKQNQFVHMHGKNKLAFLQDRYPEDQYEYLYAVSDCTSDLPLLIKFKTFDLIKKK